MGEKIEKAPGEFRFLDSDSKNIYVFRKNESWKREYRLETYSRDSLKRLASIKIPYPDIDSVKFELEDISIHPDYYQIVYSYFDSKHKQKKVDLVTFDQSGRKIGESKTIDFSEGKNSKKSGNYDIFHWKKRNEILSYSSKFADDTVYINIDHFNNNGDKQRSQNFKHGKDFGRYIYSGIDSVGNIYYLTSSKGDRDELQRSIKMYTPESDTPAVIPLQIISSNQYLLSDRYYSFSDQSGIFNLICTYSQSVDKESADGIYLIQVDTKGKMLVQEKFIRFYCADNNLGPNKKGFTIPYCVVTNALIRPGNKIEVICENRHAVTETMYGIDLVTTYETGSTFSVTLDSNYAVYRMCRIKKQQYVTGKNETYARFVLLHDSTRCFYIYNELPENLNLLPDADLKKLKDNKVDETSIILTNGG